MSNDSYRSSIPSFEYAKVDFAVCPAYSLSSSMKISRYNWQHNRENVVSGAGKMSYAGNFNQIRQMIAQSKISGNQKSPDYLNDT